MRLPDVNGLDLCRHFREQAAAGPGRVPVVYVMSGYGGRLRPAAPRRSGADAFLPKPVKIADLRKKIRGQVG